MNQTSTEKNKTVLIGIIGDSASGKTTLARGILNLLGDRVVTMICSDDYHCYNRNQRKKIGITALNPAANYIDILEQHLTHLRNGRSILKPVYNHETGEFDPPEYIKPAKIVVVEGLLGFHTRKMRDCFDIKVYMDPLEELRIQWKIKRDTNERGYTREQVLGLLEKRREDSPHFIHPQKAYADIVVRFYSPDPGSSRLQETGAGLNVQLVLRPTIPHPELTSLVEHAANKEDQPVLNLRMDRYDSKPADILEIDGKITSEKTEALKKQIANHLIPGAAQWFLRDIGVYRDGLKKGQSYPLALIQLLLTYHIIKAQETLETALS